MILKKREIIVKRHFWNIYRAHMCLYYILATLHPCHPMQFDYYLNSMHFKTYCILTNSFVSIYFNCNVSKVCILECIYILFRYKGMKFDVSYAKEFRYLIFCHNFGIYGIILRWHKKYYLIHDNLYMMKVEKPLRGHGDTLK